MEKKIKDLNEAVIVSAYPGVGKTYSFQHYQDQFTMLDSDSSLFSWIYDKNGIKTNVRNPDFPKNYMNHIKENLTKADFIFVSSHKEVREALNKSGLKYYLVFPFNTKKNKDEWLGRFLKRGNDAKFCDFIMNHWDEFIGEMEIEMEPFHICLGTNEEEIEFPKYINDHMLKDIIAFHKDWISQSHDYMDMRNIKDMV